MVPWVEAGLDHVERLEPDGNTMRLCRDLGRKPGLQELPVFKRCEIDMQHCIPGRAMAGDSLKMTGDEAARSDELSACLKAPAFLVALAHGEKAAAGRQAASPDTVSDVDDHIALACPTCSWIVWSSRPAIAPSNCVMCTHTFPMCGIPDSRSEARNPPRRLAFPAAGRDANRARFCPKLPSGLPAAGLAASMPSTWSAGHFATG